MKSPKRIVPLLALDSIIVLSSITLAAYLRFELLIPRGVAADLLGYAPLLLLIYIVPITLSGVYSVMWRYAGGRQFLYQAIVIGFAGLLTLLINQLFTWGISRTMLLMACLLAMALITASRLAARSYRAHQSSPDYRDSKIVKGSYKPLLIVGAGEAGNFVVAQSRRNPGIYGYPAALVDDSPLKQRMSVQGVPVRGRIDDIPRIVEERGIREIVIALPSVKGERIRQIIALCNATRCQVRIMSDPQGICEGTQQGMPAMREPNIADFLSREEIIIDTAHVSAYIRGQIVLVTGGGGSIGSEICRQVMKFAPKQLLIFDIYENCAYELFIELQQLYGQACKVEVLIGSVREKERLDEVMAAYKPQVVFHAAAHKHVPLMEISPAEAIKNNVLGTLNVMECAEAHGVERFVMLSTDKAVNPTNVMGATKRVAEIMMQLFARSSRMKCMAVRFGNVLGSHGSVIPLFEHQIRSGGPVTLTHPDITRYFMTIPEAASLVLQAGSMEDSGRIYVLDMGEPVRIIDLAEKLIRFYGFEPGVTMAIQVTGLRPGEKLYEELLLDDEASGMTKTTHNKIMVAPPVQKDEQLLREQMARLRRAAFLEHEHIEALLTEILPNFRHMLNGDCLHSTTDEPEEIKY